MKSWGRQHVFALFDALRHMRKPRGGFLLNVAVIAIALALPFAGLTILENVRPVSDQIAVEPELSVFLRMDIPRDKATALGPAIQRILKDGGSAYTLEFIGREKALNALKEKSGLSEALASLGTNPLPDAYVVKLAGFQGPVDAEKVEAIATRLKALPAVESVQVDSAWVKRLAALIHLLRLLLLMLAITLGTVVVAVVFNTIRLQVMNRREEIEVSRLVGATDGFVYRPFYYYGALLGLCAGGIALFSVGMLLHPLNSAIAEIARLYASEFRLLALGVAPTLLLLAMSAALGLLGALLSVKRYLTITR